MHCILINFYIKMLILNEKIDLLTLQSLFPACIIVLYFYYKKFKKISVYKNKHNMIILLKL